MTNGKSASGLFSRRMTCHSPTTLAVRFPLVQTQLINTCLAKQLITPDAWRCGFNSTLMAFGKRLIRHIILAPIFHPAETLLAFNAPLITLGCVKAGDARFSFLDTCKIVSSRTRLGFMERFRHFIPKRMADYLARESVYRLPYRALMPFPKSRQEFYRKHE